MSDARRPTHGLLGSRIHGSSVGLGLGLHISSRIIIAQHDGQVGVDSALGEGTTF
ncbi:MAG: hypothetical protein M3Y74_18310 [Chloroflexota bacterium]|nr:hypothetical protein [Chloroflexota bacterium]